jgi:nicotinamide riboside kinase
LFGDCPSWLEPALLARHYDLHLLLSPEQVEWVGDGLRCQPALAERVAFFEAIEGWLVRQRQPFVKIEGDWAQRREQVFAAVSRLLQA